VPHAQLLLDSGLILGLVALSGIVFRALRLSTIPAYILLGLLLSPMVGRSELVEFFALWGVVLLMFFVGLEFSFSSFIARRQQLFRLGTIDLLINFPLGFVAGLALGWGPLGGLFIGGAFYISSSAIVARSLIELQRTAHPETEPALGILVAEDMAVALLIAILSGIVLQQDDLSASLFGALRGVLFLAAAIMAARIGRPLLDRLLATEDDELFVLLMGAVLLLLSYAAMRSGVSEAVGAFLTGSLMAETRHKVRIEALFAPLQGLFAALFFLSFGLSVNTSALGEVWPGAVLLVLLAIPAKLLTGWIAGGTEGLSRRARLSLGLTLVPRGEFSILLAGVAATAGYERAPALITLFVLILAVVGTIGIQYAPVLTRWGSRAKNAKVTSPPPTVWRS
jgi:CPA2 family monovalent cation:H+ antiporter-2